MADRTRVPLSAGTSPPRRRTRTNAAADREALAFLKDRILPALHKERNFALLKAVRPVVESARLSALSTLPERQRHDLLLALEEAVERRRARLEPRALVRMTTVISRAPALDARLAGRLSPPAR